MAFLCIDGPTLRVRRYEPRGGGRVRVTNEAEILRGSDPELVKVQLEEMRATQRIRECPHDEPTAPQPRTA